MSEKRMHPKDVNELMTRKPGSRASMAQHAILLARLERRKTILETQARICEAKQRVVERRLHLVKARIGNAMQALSVTRPAPQTVNDAERPEPTPDHGHIFDFTF